jgi:tripartite-type tricarboxylate transporter receptor subunit TctC
VSAVPRAKPHGYTIDLGTLTSHVMNGAFYSLQYDLLSDFSPVSPLVTTPYVLYARKSMPARDLTELVAWLKANPNRASKAVVGGSSQLLTAIFQKETATQFAHVPYRGGAPALQDLMAGQIDLAFGTPDALSLMRAGSIKAYAVTSDTRLGWQLKFRRFANWDCPHFHYQFGPGFSRRGARRRKLSASSMRRP